MVVTFENELGRLRFGGGDSVLALKAISGLGPPKKEFHVMGYAGRSGQELVSEKDMARVITISCDVKSAVGVAAELSRMMRILNHVGRMTIFTESRTRSSVCRCSLVEEPERHGKEIRSVVLQFTCDKPYFSDGDKQKAVLLAREKKLASPFTLGCVFSERVSRGIVVNRGDFQAEPVVLISHSADSDIAAQEAEESIEVINHTTGQSIMLSRVAERGEVICIDIPQRKITSSVAGDITCAITENTFLSDFVLAVGANDIEAVNSSAEKDLSVALEYDNQYIEAVV